MSSPSSEVLYFGNDMILEVRGLQNEVTGAYLNSATVTVTLIDKVGAQVAGASWPMSMAYVAASDGVYRATLPYSLSVTRNARYTAIVDINAGTGQRARFDVPVLCKTRD